MAPAVERLSAVIELLAVRLESPKDDTALEKPAFRMSHDISAAVAAGAHLI